MDMKVNREYRNSVFIDMFEQAEYRLQLFRTLHPEMTDVTADDIEMITLKQVVTNHQYNDLAFLVKGRQKDRLMVFVESQSTWSINILIRILLYLADTIQEYLHAMEKDIHDQKQIELPEPEFYVIYTGKRQIPPVISLRNDFFRDPDGMIDLTARVYTSETKDIIGQYIIFCRVLEDQIRINGRTGKAARETIRICQDRGVLADYLKEREKEVINIMITLFDQEYAVNQYGKAQRKEGREEGRIEGREEGREEGWEGAQISNIRKMMNKLKMTAESAMDLLDIPEEEKGKYTLLLKEAEVGSQYSAEG